MIDSQQLSWTNIRWLGRFRSAATFAPVALRRRRLWSPTSVRSMDTALRLSSLFTRVCVQHAPQTIGRDYGAWLTYQTVVVRGAHNGCRRTASQCQVQTHTVWTELIGRSVEQHGRVATRTL